MALVIMASVGLFVVVGVLIIWLVEPKSKALKEENKRLYRKVNELTRQLQHKEDELAVFRWGSPWQATEKETHGTQE